MTVRYASHVNRKQTPQTEPIPGTVPNNAGGYAYETDKWARLQRFLILGSDGGTYYVSEKKLTRQNAAVVEACLAEDAVRTIDTIVMISDTGRAPKNDPAIFALALAASTQNPDATGLSAETVRLTALGALQKVCRIPTHLFHFLAYCKSLRRWSRSLRTAVRDWYAQWDAGKLAYELVKYQSRDGWANKDALRLAHGTYPPALQATIRWAIGAKAHEARTVRRKNAANREDQYQVAGALPMIIGAYEEAKTDVDVKMSNPPILLAACAARHVARIKEYGLSREMLPTEALNDVSVWEALLEKMPLTALVRNLGKMTEVGLLAPLSAASKSIATRLADPEAIAKARLHPLAILVALKTYAQGHGDKGKLTWDPVEAVVDALDAAFYLAFGNVPVTGKNIMLACDVSGSMTMAGIAGSPLTPRDATAALALITASVEPNYLITGFTTSMTPLKISPRQRLDAVVAYMDGLPFGGTDCSLPMIYAAKKKLDIDAFIVLTDSETWAGAQHPSQALAAYRKQQEKPRAASIVVGMTATSFSIADPKDARSLDVIGFDLATPGVMSEFISAP